MVKKTRNSVGCIGDVQALAPSDPSLAYALWMSAGNTPQIFSLMATLSTGNLDEEVDASTADGPSGSAFCSDFIILSSRYQIRRTLAFAGSIFKAQSDVNNALNSGIDVRLTMERCPKFDIVGDDTPIELVSDPPGTEDSCCAFPYGFVAPNCSAIHAFFTNRRALAPAELPTQIWMAFRGVSLCMKVCDVDPAKAVAELKAAGFLP